MNYIYILIYVSVAGRFDFRLWLSRPEIGCLQKTENKFKIPDCSIIVLIDYLLDSE